MSLIFTNVYQRMAPHKQTEFSLFMRCHALIHIRWKGSHSYQEATRKINIFARWDLGAKGKGLLLDGVQQPFKRIILDPF